MMNITKPFDSNKQAFTTSKISDFKHSSICKQVWTMLTEDKKSKNHKYFYKILKNRGMEKTYLASLGEFVDRAVLRRHRFLLTPHRWGHRFLLPMHRRWHRLLLTAQTQFFASVQNTIRS